MSSYDLELVEYSERSLAIFGDTKDFKEQFKKLGGKYNAFLSYEGAKKPGWIFTKKSYDSLIEFFDNATPDEEVKSNGLLSDKGKLTDTGKQFIDAMSGTQSQAKRSLVKKPHMNIDSVPQIVLTKSDFRLVRKREVNAICLEKPSGYESLLPGMNVTLTNGEVSLTRKVTGVGRYLEKAAALKGYEKEDIIVLEDDLSYDYWIIIQFA